MQTQPSQKLVSLASRQQSPLSTSTLCQIKMRTPPPAFPSSSVSQDPNGSPPGQPQFDHSTGRKRRSSSPCRNGSPSAPKKTRVVSPAPLPPKIAADVASSLKKIGLLKIVKKLPAPYRGDLIALAQKIAQSSQDLVTQSHIEYMIWKSVINLLSRRDDELVWLPPTLAGALCDMPLSMQDAENRVVDRILEAAERGKTLKASIERLLLKSNNPEVGFNYVLTRILAQPVPIKAKGVIVLINKISDVFGDSIAEREEENLSRQTYLSILETVQEFPTEYQEKPLKALANAFSGALASPWDIGNPGDDDLIPEIFDDLATAILDLIPDYSSEPDELLITLVETLDASSQLSIDGDMFDRLFNRIIESSVDVDKKRTMLRKLQMQTQNFSDDVAHQYFEKISTTYLTLT